jgi:hypothetical protein
VLKKVCVKEPQLLFFILDWGKQYKLSKGSEDIEKSCVAIIISDFISTQVFDKNRNWSNHLKKFPRFLLISLHTNFDPVKLKEFGISETLSQTGFLPIFTKKPGADAICISPDVICNGGDEKSNIFDDICNRIIRSVLLPRSKVPCNILKLSIKSIGPSVNPNPGKKQTWSSMAYVTELEISKRSVFAQSKNTRFFDITAYSARNSKDISIPNFDISLISPDSHWVDLSQSGSVEKKPYHAAAQNTVNVALLHVFLPNKASGKEPSQSSGELSIAGLRRFISSGYTYTYLFLKKSRKSQKVYSVTVVLDATQRVFSPLNLAHTFLTTGTLLESFAYIPDNEEIIVDILVASHNSVHVTIYNFPANKLSSPSLLWEILITAKENAGVFSGIGSGLRVAHSIAANRNGIECGSYIFVLTDGVISHLSEVNAFGYTLNECESAGISVVGVGLGIAPLQLPNLFPVALHSPRYTDFGVAIAAALEISPVGAEEEISVSSLTTQINIERVRVLFDRLRVPRAVRNQSLVNDIRDRKVSFDMVERFANKRLVLMDPNNKEGSKILENPQEEPYKDGAFSGFRILVACLYYENQLEPEVFHKGCGNSLKRKGFNG